MEESAVRKELDAFLEQQKKLGAKRRDIALVLFARGYSEKSVGLVMGIHSKSAHAMKISFSAEDKKKQERTGKRVHLDASGAQLKRVEGRKVLSRFIELVDMVLAESKEEQRSEV